MSATNETPTTEVELVPISYGEKRGGVSGRTIRNWIAEGRLTGYRLGPRLLRIDRNEFETLIVRQVPTTARD